MGKPKRNMDVCLNSVEYPLDRKCKCSLNCIIPLCPVISDCSACWGDWVDVLSWTSHCKARLDGARPSEQLPGTFVFSHDRIVLKALSKRTAFEHLFSVLLPRHSTALPSTPPPTLTRLCGNRHTQNVPLGKCVDGSHL